MAWGVSTAATLLTPKDQPSDSNKAGIVAPMVAALLLQAINNTTVLAQDRGVPLPWRSDGRIYQWKTGCSNHVEVSSPARLCGRHS